MTYNDNVFNDILNKIAAFCQRMRFAAKAIYQKLGVDTCTSMTVDRLMANLSRSSSIMNVMPCQSFKMTP